MSLKKLVEEITKPVIDEMGIVASDGTIKGGSKLSKIKKGIKLIAPNIEINVNLWKSGSFDFQ